MFIKHLFDARNSILYSDHLLSLHVSSVAIQNQYEVLYTIEEIFIHLVSTFLSQFVKNHYVVFLLKKQYPYFHVYFCKNVNMGI